MGVDIRHSLIKEECTIAAYEQFAYSYDRLMEDMPYPAWINFARQAWESLGQEPKTIVDLGCGTGNIAIPLAQQGMRVTGIDLSSDMLAVASDKTDRMLERSAFARGGSVTWLQQDIREWELAAPVDAVFSFCDCMNYLTEEEDITAAIRRTYDGLKPGGSFLFDVHTPSHLKAYAEMQPFIFNERDLAYIWTCELDEERCEIEHDLTIFSKEGNLYRRTDELHVQRAYPLDWLRDELLRCGFERVGMYADFTMKPPGPDTARAFFVAVKA